MASATLSSPIVLLNVVTVDTVGDSFKIPVPEAQRGGALYSAFVGSTDFGGGILHVEVSPYDDESAWFIARSRNDNRAIFTVAGHLVLHLQAKWVRGRLFGSTNPAALTVILL